jgi:hypothetical protein
MHLVPLRKSGLTFSHQHFVIPKFYYFAQNDSRNLGKVQRRHPYNLGKHSNSNKNFEIHIFALLTFWRKFQDVTDTL